MTPPPPSLSGTFFPPRGSLRGGRIENRWPAEAREAFQRFWIQLLVTRRVNAGGPAGPAGRRRFGLGGENGAGRGFGVTPPLRPHLRPIG